MSYSKNTRKNTKSYELGRRVLKLMICTAVIFGGIGFGIGFLTTRGEAKTETVIYGEYDGKIFEGDMPELKTTDEFIPLDVPLGCDLQEYIFRLSEAYEINFPMVISLIQQESDFNPAAVSETGDYGLMQINQVNHAYLSKELGVTDFMDPYQNVKAGMFILRKLFEEYGETEKVLMAYNMGEAGAGQLWEQGVLESNFSRNVLKKQAEYAAEIERSKNK